ncbi:MAG TPA: IS3 family transposase [Ktedonobacteraceae bacterium]
MQKVQKTYKQEFKREAVRLAQTSGKSIAQVARELGISDSSIHQWRKELAEHGAEAFPGSGHQTALEEENRRLKRELERTRQERDILKKTGQYLLARPAVRYQAVEDYRQEYPVQILCDTLGVSVSGYYIWKKRPMSEHCRADGELAEQIQAVYQSCRQVYGSPRIHAELRARGITSSRKRVARLMRERGLSARRRHHKTITTKSEPGARVAPNLLDQDFTASRPNEKWTGDITAVWTYEGWLYLAVVLDLFSRRVIGWAMAATQDEMLIESALGMALLARHPSADLWFHSDRGSQYTSDRYRAALAEAGITVSMSRTGNCYDNAVTESFFGTLNGECVERVSFQTRGQARQVIFEYVECFYNRIRRHSTLGYVSPVVFEQVMC